MDIEVISVLIPGAHGLGVAMPGIKEIHAQTYSEIPTINGRAFVSVAADETNDGLSSLYYHDESGLHWIPLV